jgi:hypothetical protein
MIASERGPLLSNPRSPPDIISSRWMTSCAARVNSAISLDDLAAAIEHAGCITKRLNLLRFLSQSAISSFNKWSFLTPGISKKSSTSVARYRYSRGWVSLFSSFAFCRVHRLNYTLHEDESNNVGQEHLDARDNQIEVGPGRLPV